MPSARSEPSSHDTIALSDDGVGAVADRPLLAGRYRLRSAIGSGGMAVVWRADDLQARVIVAVKVLRPGMAGARHVARLAREAVTMRFLDHPNVPTVRDMGRDEVTGEFFFVMDCAERGSAWDALRAHGPLPPDLVAGWAVDVLAALAVAHARGIVHRDVKPANVLVRGDGRALLADWGIVRTPEGELPVEPGASLGTPNYMPPEQRRRADDTGPAGDVYATGATMFVLLTARSPSGLAFADEDDPLWEQVPAALRPIVRRAVRPDPALRWPDAHAMALALAPFARAGLWTRESHLAAWLGLDGYGPATEAR